jgi:hypothetical protein
MSREVRWVPEHPYHLLQTKQAPKPDLQDLEFALARERAAFYYIRQLLEIPLIQPEQQPTGETLSVFIRCRNVPNTFSLMFLLFSSIRLEKF